MRRLTLTALSGCMLLTCNCAGQTPTSPAAPRIDMPAEARAPCGLYVLPESPTRSDLEAGYEARGSQIVACDAARKLAVQTHDDEHALMDKADAERRDRSVPAWRRWLRIPG